VGRKYKAFRKKAKQTEVVESREWKKGELPLSG
jgi:hypothetical protein